MPDLIRQQWKLPGKRSAKFYNALLYLHLTQFVPQHIIIKINAFRCDDEKEVREFSLLASSDGWKPNERSEWGNSEHRKRRGP